MIYLMTSKRTKAVLNDHSFLMLSYILIKLIICSIKSFYVSKFVSLASFVLVKFNIWIGLQQAVLANLI